MSTLMGLGRCFPLRGRGADSFVVLSRPTLTRLTRSYSDASHFPGCVESRKMRVASAQSSPSGDVR
jgi:hypothetical protein